jgi:TatA/E family protein of Tat protein translocase
MIGSQDLLIALALGLLLFGAKKLPELARGLGESLKEFKRATTQPDPPPPATPAAPTVAPPPGRRCPNCQTELQADWAHCPRCGTAGPAG